MAWALGRPGLPDSREEGLAHLRPGPQTLWCHLPVSALLTPQSLSYTWAACRGKVQAWGEDMALSFQEKMSPWPKQQAQAEP